MASPSDAKEFIGRPLEYVPAPSPSSLRERVREAAEQFEATVILQALEQHQWNRRRTAEALRISYRSLMYKMKRCNVRKGRAVPQEAD